jgi:hypothetical protein
LQKYCFPHNNGVNYGGALSSAEKLSAIQKYWFRKITVEIKVARYQAQKKYRHRKNIGFDKIIVEIKVARYQAQKKYQHRKNIGFDKILVEIKVARYQAQKKYQHRKNIGFNKTLVRLRWHVIKRRKIIGIAKILVSTK